MTGSNKQAQTESAVERHLFIGGEETCLCNLCTEKSYPFKSLGGGEESGNQKSSLFTKELGIFKVSEEFSLNDLRLGSLKTDRMVDWPNCYVECPPAAVKLLSQSISSHPTGRKKAHKVLKVRLLSLGGEEETSYLRSSPFLVNSCSISLLTYQRVYLIHCPSVR